MILWVAGGRDYEDRVAIRAGLAPYMVDGNVLITGSARGVDRIAEEIWQDHQLPYVGVPAQWRKFGNSAGYKRNYIIATGLLECLRPDILIHFPGGHGTEGSITLAKQLGIKTVAGGGE